MTVKSCGGWTIFTITKTVASHSYLLELAAFGAHEGQRVVLVDVRNDGSHAVPVFCEDWNATYHFRHSQRSIHIQAAEVVINGQELKIKWEKS